MNDIAQLNNAFAEIDARERPKERCRSSALALAFFDDCLDAQPKHWLIKNVLARGESSSWFGAPGSLKSALLTDISMHVAEGRDWRGYRTNEAAGVVFFALERAALTRRRIAAHAKRDALQNVWIAVCGDIINLTDLRCVDIIVATVRAAETQWGRKVGLIVFDTTSKGIAAGGGDEDKAKDQNIIAANMKRVHQQLDVHIAGIGHSGKDEGRGERGSNARLADVDAQFQITGSDIKIVNTTKANDQPEGLLTAFRGEQIQLGVDEDGEPFGAFIVSAEPIEGAASQPTKAAHPTKAAQIALRALSEELADVGQPAPTDPHIPADVSVVPISAWRQRAYRMGISASGEDRAKQQAFKRGAEWLIGNGRVAVWDDLAWLPR